MPEIHQYQNIVYKIIGAAMTVHRELNFGLLEAIYQEALESELNTLGIQCKTECSVPVYYKGNLLKKHYEIDLLAGDIICELKSVSKIIPAHRAQLCNYLRLTHKPIGLLINFGTNKLECERWAYRLDTNDCFLVDINLNPVI